MVLTFRTGKGGVTFTPGQGFQSVAPSQPGFYSGGTRLGGGGGSGGGQSTTSQTELAARQEELAAQAEASRKATEEAARQEAARKAAAEAEAQRKAQEQKIIIKASGAIQIGTSRYAGNVIVPNTGGMTANQYATTMKQRAIEQGVIDKKDYGRATLTISRETPTEKQQTSTRTVTLNQPASYYLPSSANLPSGSMPQFGDFVIRPSEGKGTRTDIGKVDADIPLYQEGTIYQAQIGTFKAGGRDIPITQTYTIGENGSRPATSEERALLQEEITQQSFTETQIKGLAGTPSRIKLVAGDMKGQYKEWASEEFIDIKATQDFFSKGGRVGEFTGGVIVGAFGTKGDLVRTGVITGVSAGAGFGIQALSKAIPLGAGGVAGYIFGAQAATRVASVTATTLQIGKIGAGVYFGGQFAYTTATRISQAENAFEKGKITGRAVADVGAGIYGFKIGTQGYNVVEGLIKTRGRTFIDIPQGEYPQAATSKQLKMFQENVYKELGARPGAFHTTSNVWSDWKSGKIVPSTGTSELPGLYGSTKISTPFSRITGSSSTAKFNFMNWAKEIFAAPTEPGVAFLQPEGFRYSPFTRTSYSIGEQPFKYKFVEPPKAGFADVPLLKTEIEAVFRPGAGGYSISSKGFYTTIKGVRVPVDSFVYNPSVVASSTGAITLKGGASSYSNYVAPSYSNPTAGLLASFSSSSSKVSKPSSISLTPSYSLVSSVLPSYSIKSSVVGSSVSRSSSRSSTSRASSPSVSKAYSSIVGKSSVSKSVSKVFPSYARPYRSLPVPSYVPSKTTATGYKFPSMSKVKQPRGLFPVFARRFKKWKTVAVGRTPEEALLFGKRYSRRTLGRSFYVAGVRQPRQIRGFRTKQEKGIGQIFIQKPGKGLVSTLGSAGEKAEIKMFRQASNLIRRRDGK